MTSVIVYSHYSLQTKKGIFVKNNKHSQYDWLLSDTQIFYPAVPWIDQPYEPSWQFFFEILQTK